MTERGRSLELFFVNGRPDGMLTAEVFNWTGHVLMFPRTQMREALVRAEARYTGVYVLLNDDEADPKAYIGESENVAERIRNHDASRDWWTHALIVTSASDNLHKAHVKYLESRMVERARAVGLVPLENGNTPPRASLSEAATANMEEFLDTLFMVLPALGVSAFESKKRPDRPAPSGNDDPDAVRFRLITPRNGIDASAVLSNGEFIMERGSRVRSTWAGTGEHDFGYRKIHERLVAAGVIDASTSPALLTENYAFNSASAAAAVANGRPANGRIEWKHAVTGATFGEWEEAQIRDGSVAEDPLA
jgi:hypothetical protein